MYGTLEDAKAKLADLVVAAATESKLQHVFLGWDGMHVAFLVRPLMAPNNKMAALVSVVARATCQNMAFRG